MKSRWLTAVDDERGTLKIEFNSGMAFLHLSLKRALQGIRDCRALLPQLKSWLRSMGHDRVFVIIPEGDGALHRFETSFGFQEIRRRGGQILMGQDC